MRQPPNRPHNSNRTPHTSYLIPHTPHQFITSKNLGATSKKLGTTSKKLEATSKNLGTTSKKLEATSKNLGTTSKKLGTTSKNLGGLILWDFGDLWCCVKWKEMWFLETIFDFLKNINIFVRWKIKKSAHNCALGATLWQLPIKSKII